MESITFQFIDYQYKAINRMDNDLGYLCGFLTGHVIWWHLVDPERSESYSCGDYYCTRRSKLDLYISDIVNVDIAEDEDAEYPPIIVNLNTVLGLLVAFETIGKKTPRPQEFVITQDNQRYIFTSNEMSDSIVVDPNLGKLYNETVPYMIIKQQNNVIDCVLHSNNDPSTPYSFYKYSDDELTLLYELLRSTQFPELLFNLYNWPKDTRYLVYGDIKVSNSLYSVAIKNKKTGLFISKHSLINLLLAWQKRLQYCDVFTIVLLGKTLRFFEGEPQL